MALAAWRGRGPACQCPARIRLRRVEEAADQVLPDVGIGSCGWTRPRSLLIRVMLWESSGTSNSRMTEWWTTMSIAAAVAMGLVKMCSHWEKTKLDVMPRERRS